MTLEEAIKLLKIQYERAKKIEYVRNPLAWAIYQVWKQLIRKVTVIGKK